MNSFFYLSSIRTKMVLCRSFTCSFTNNRRTLGEFGQKQYRGRIHKDNSPAKPNVHFAG